MDDIGLIVICFFWLILALSVGVYASNKGVPGGFLGSFFISMMFSPVIGLIAVAVSKPDNQRMEQRDLQSGMKKCPDCAELIKSEARKCKHCGKQFEGTVI